MVKRPLKHEMLFFVHLLGSRRKDDRRTTCGEGIADRSGRGQWSALERERQIKRVCWEDFARYASYEVMVEQEPGSGGKESAENTIRMLAGIRVTADRVTGNKEVRAEPFAAQVQGDNVSNCRQ
jgi:hypothetical protein